MVYYAALQSAIVVLRLWDCADHVYYSLLSTQYAVAAARRIAMKQLSFNVAQNLVVLI